MIVRAEGGEVVFGGFAGFGVPVVDVVEFGDLGGAVAVGGSAFSVPDVGEAGERGGWVVVVAADRDDLPVVGVGNYSAKCGVLAVGDFVGQPGRDEPLACHFR